jgi:AcrR family transcriptional regulator
MTATTKQEVVQEFRMQSIRDAASRVVSQHGVAGATIDAIAAEAGIAKGTIYLYFKSREELLEHAADHAVQELLAQIEGVLRSSEPFDTQLRTFIRTVVSYFDEHQNFFRLYQAASREDKCRSRRYVNYSGSIREWIKRAMEADQIRRLDVDRVALVLTESLSVVIRRRQSEPPPPIDADTEWLASLFLHGLVPPVKGKI